MKQVADINDLIFQQLKSKSSLKQKTYRNLLEVFSLMKKEASKIAEELNNKIKEVDTSVIVGFKDINEFEFQIKFSGDILVFVVQTNIITFNNDHHVIKSAYVKENTNRKYFGHIMVYNFLADSIKYNRLEDPGYLVARILINHENRFFVEGVRQLNFLFTDISKNIISIETLRSFIQKAISTSIENDLIGPNYPDIKEITLYQKMNQNINTGQKIGFQINSHDIKI